MPAKSRSKKKSSRRGSAKSSGVEREITSFAIHPAIGVARVGNAPKQYFLAPEAPGMLPDPDGPVPGREDDWRPGYKDDEGRIKRQACRFRIYGLDARGRVVKEITADDAHIEWRVHLAARKAAWYQFNNAMDLGEHAKEALMRNAGTDRKKLAITPPPASISGRNTNASGGDRSCRIAGRIMGKYPAVLGELRSDDKGRLVVLGGPGDANSFTGFINPITTFANNEGWYDDIADGPVRATVRLKGSRQKHEAEPAFVATTPPNYGPGLLGVVTMYDVALDLFHRESVGGEPPIPLPERPSFARHIYPILERLVNTQWVNDGFFVLFGDGSAADFTTPERLRRLSTLGNTPAQRRQHERARQAVFAWFRDPASTKPEPAEVPPFYGDAFGDFSGLPNDELAVTHTQYGWLQQWAKGDFDEDFRRPRKPVPLESLAIAKQPHALDRAHLEDILGGPFHPGIEITWTMRRASMWKAPFRLNVLPEGQQPRDDFGPILRPDVCLGPDGPLNASGPGSLTRWMGTPWQTDSASCLSGYDASYYLPLPSFWAARIPNQVLSRFSYEKSIDPAGTPVQRQRFFSQRSDWLRDLAPSGNARRQDMVENWWKLGIVVPMPAPRGRQRIVDGTKVWIESGRNAQFTVNDPTRKMVERAQEQVGPALDGKGTEQSHVALAQREPPEGEDARTVHIANRRRVYGRSDR
ncbi:MAG: LodA/GoxA family CTQ-dependent oxidase [Myxococcota bacterium]